MKRWLGVLAGVTAMSAFAGPYDQPYALVERGDPSEVRKEATVAITKIDGDSTRNPRKSDPIAPGKHKVTIHFESARGNFRPEFVDLELDLAPCTLYRVWAKYESKTGPDWKPVVRSEKLGDCERKFAKGAAKK